MLSPIDVLRSASERSGDLSWPFPTWKDFRAASTFTQINYTNVVLIVIFLVYAIYQAKSKNDEADKAGRGRRYLPSPDFPPVQAQADFDYATTEPVKLWPFKPRYNLTMALEKLDPNDLLLMDKTYPSRLAYRSKIIEKYKHDVCGVSHESVIGPAVRELYTFLMGTYLPVRFPRMFKLHETHYETGKRYMLENLVTGEIYPASPISPNTTVLTLLQTLGKTIDEDFFFLLPSDPSEPPDPSDSSASASASTSASEEAAPASEEAAPASEEAAPASEKAAPASEEAAPASEKAAPASEKAAPEKAEDQSKHYHLHAFVCCCPTGFSPSAKLGLPLAAIHKPVPGYSPILQSSMDRYFAKLKVGTYVKRVNWAVTTHGELYASPKADPDENNNSIAHNTHAYEGDEITELADIDVNQTFVRCERQTLHRLPKSKAIVFAFKTLLYPIEQMKLDRGPEGAEELAQAIDGLTKGNVPGINFYRRGAAWAAATKRYLRSWDEN